MMGRMSWLVVSVGLLPGCVTSGHKTVDPAVPAKLNSTMLELSPANIRQTEATMSPYNQRVSPFAKEEPAKTEKIEPAAARGTSETESIHSAVLTETRPPAPPLYPGATTEVDPLPIPRTKKERPAAKKADKPSDPLVEAFACFREGRTAEGHAHLKRLDPTTREAITTLLTMTAGLEKTYKEGKPGEYSALVEKLENLAHNLRPRAALAIEKLCYCRSIKKFGVYDPLPASHAFQAGSKTRTGDSVLLYVELRNFSSIQRDELNETALACTLEILNKAGEHVRPKMTVSAHAEQSRSPRHDAYIPCHFYVPDLDNGEYTLWIHVMDVTGLKTGTAPTHRIASRSIPFHIRKNEIVMSQR